PRLRLAVIPGAAGKAASSGRRRRERCGLSAGHYVIARHGESTLNSENRVNGNPRVPVQLTNKGRDEARLLGQQISHAPFDLCVHTRFLRTRETAELALAGRNVPF